MIRHISSSCMRQLRITLRAQQSAGPNAVFVSLPNHQSNQQSSGFATRPFKITGLDHLVLTVQDLDKTVEFYTKVLGMEATTFRGGRKALNFGEQKINLHERGKEFDPKAVVPTPGSADLCFITGTGLDDVQEHLQRMTGAPLQGLHLHSFSHQAVVIGGMTAISSMCIEFHRALDNAKCNVPVVEGPVERTGAVGGIRSVYVRDPDGNLIEISNYIKRVIRP